MSQPERRTEVSSSVATATSYRFATEDILPSPVLAAVLSEVLRDPAVESGVEGPWEIVARDNRLDGFFPKEVVTLRAAGSRERTVFCKYELESRHDAFGHRGGVRYELQMYRSALAALDVTVPKLLGTAALPEGRGLCLVLEYLPDALHVSQVSDPAALTDAARWIGRLHRLAERWLRRAALPTLRVYDHAYYAAWAHRTLRFIGPSDPARAWLVRVRNGYEARIPTLLAHPRTLIHGEYYPNNILVSPVGVHPVDWETAAVANGAVDLATLTQDWPPETRGRMESAYIQERWSDDVPPAFNECLATARLYVAFRWLGEDPRWLANPRIRAGLEDLRVFAEDLGLL